MSVPDEEIDAFMDEHDMDSDKAKWIGNGISHRLEAVNIYVDEYEVREQLLDATEKYDTSLAKAGLAFEIKKLNENGLTIEHVPKAERRMFDYDAEIEVDTDNLPESDTQDTPTEIINGDDDDSGGAANTNSHTDEHGITDEAEQNNDATTGGDSPQESEDPPVATADTHSSESSTEKEDETDPADLTPAEFFTREQNKVAYETTYDGSINPDGPFVKIAQRQNRPTRVKVKLKLANYRDTVKLKLASYRDTVKQLFSDKRV